MKNISKKEKTVLRQRKWDDESDNKKSSVKTKANEKWDKKSADAKKIVLNISSSINLNVSNLNAKETINLTINVS